MRFIAKHKVRDSVWLSLIIWTIYLTHIVLPCLSLSPFKSVSRLAKLIDDAKNRTARQQMPPSLMKELNSNDTTTIKTAAKREVLLDALGNVPLKVRYISDICLYIVLTLLDSMPNLMRTFTRLVSLPLKSSMMSTLTTLMTLPQHRGRLR